jgi:hypothetical protein
VRELGRNHPQVVFDFGRQQKPVLEADFVGRAFQVNLDPAIALRHARGLAQARIGAGLAGERASASMSAERKEGARDALPLL